MKIFNFEEIIPPEERNPNWENLYINNDVALQLLIGRLIIGDVKVENTISGNFFEQQTNYLQSFYTSNSDNIIEKLAEYISEDLTVEDLVNYYSEPLNKLRNKAFYERLANEITNFLYFQNKESYTTAFVYICRILELISYPFPLLYASQTQDFKHTYQGLKKFFDDNKGNQKGELGFYKSFILKIFEDNPIKETSVDFNFNNIPNIGNLKQKLYNKIKHLGKPNIFHENSIEFDKLSVKFTQLSSFIILLRNRFFHQFNRGDPNFETTDIFDADIFFKNFNEKCFGWIGTIYFEIMKISLSEIRT